MKRQSAGSRLNVAKESSQLQLSSSTSQFLNRTMNRDGDDLNIRYVTDIDSIRQQHLMEKAPRFNPDTRTYFKCSIYSPSNRLYTVNEEVNSTMSGGEPDTFSYSGGLRQGLRN